MLKLVMNFKKLIFIFSFLLLTNLYADFFIENTTTGIVKNEGYKLPNGNEFALLKGTYQWTNNLGYYGTATCKGLLEKESELSSINFLCESINQKGDKQYSIFKRESNDLQSGSGKSTIVDATGDNKILIGIECNFAVSYLKNVAFAKMKCPVSEKVFNELKNKL